MPLDQDLKSRFEVSRPASTAADGRVWLSCANERCHHRFRLCRGSVDAAVTLHDPGPAAVEIRCRGCKLLNYVGRRSPS